MTETEQTADVMALQLEVVRHRAALMDWHEIADKLRAEIARQREVIEAWFDVSAKAERRQIALETALRELLEASEMSERDLELCEYETIMEDAQTRARELLS